jgi:ankyrin repeat protein
MFCICRMICTPLNSSDMRPSRVTTESLVTQGSPVLPFVVQVDLHTPDSSGVTATQLAANHHHLPIVAMLLEKWRFAITSQQPTSTAPPPAAAAGEAAGLPGGAAGTESPAGAADGGVVRSFCSCKKSYRLSQKSSSSSSSRECVAAGSQDGGSSDGSASSSNALHLAVLSGLEAVLVQLLRAPGVDVNFRWVQASVRGAGELLLHAAKGEIGVVLNHH